MKTLLTASAAFATLSACRHTETPPDPAVLEISPVEQRRQAEAQDAQSWSRMQAALGPDFFKTAEIASDGGWIVYGQKVTRLPEGVEAHGPFCAVFPGQEKILFGSSPALYFRISGRAAEDPVLEAKHLELFTACGQPPHPWSHLCQRRTD